MSDGSLADLGIGSAAGKRSDLVRRLVEGASRARLEAARDALVARLWRRSDDLEASVPSNW